MRETKEQKMARLERQKAEKEEEIKQLRKENHRLKRMVETIQSKTNVDKNFQMEVAELNEKIFSLSKEKEKALKDAENIKLFYQRQIKSLNSEIAKFDKSEKAIKIRAGLYITKRIEKLRSRQIFTEEEINNLSRFNDGKLSGADYIQFFDHASLFIRINPKNGRDLEWVDYVNIHSHFNDRYEYLNAKEDYKKFLTTHPNISEKEKSEYVYKVGMKLLPLYEKYIY